MYIMYVWMDIYNIRESVLENCQNIAQIQIQTMHNHQLWTTLQLYVRTHEQTFLNRIFFYGWKIYLIYSYSIFPLNVQITLTNHYARK